MILVLKYFPKHSRVNILFKGVVGAEGVKQSADAAVRVQNLHRRIVPNLDSTVQFVNKAPDTSLEFTTNVSWLSVSGFGVQHLVVVLFEDNFNVRAKDGTVELSITGPFS